MIRFFILTLVLAATACAPLSRTRDSAPSRIPADLDQVPDAVPSNEPLSRYGNRQRYTVLGKTYQTLSSAKGYQERGIASWYGAKFHGRRTSNGETYDMFTMTGAHKALPLPTYVQVRNLENGRVVVVRVNDRGPFHDDRIIDLSYAAAYKLDMLGKGTAPVELTALDPELREAANSTEATQLASDTMIYFVQTGAFADKQGAEALRAKIALNTALISGIKDADHASYGKIYRVQLGPFGSREDAQTVVEKLLPLGISDARILTGQQG